MKARSYCISFGCLNTNKDPNLTFFSLPKDAKRRREWLILVNRQDLLLKEGMKRKSHVLCSEHFEDSSIKMIKHLKENAVPTMLLPSEYKEWSSCSEAPSTSAQTKGKDEVLSNKVIEEEKYETVETQIESLQSTKVQAQTSKSLVDRMPRKRILLNELKEFKLKRKRIDKKIMKIMKELKAIKKSDVDAGN